MTASQRDQQAARVLRPGTAGTDRKKQALVGILKEWHEWAGVAGYRLSGLHAAAGLPHYYINRDHTLTRMLPGQDSSPEPAACRRLHRVSTRDGQPLAVLVKRAFRR
ncbi:hypothetical protein HP532_13750 [Pseudomonas sp. CrR25]|nr:hypothetical protein [Pseudomonas sp. CrR25]